MTVATIKHRSSENVGDLGLGDARIMWFRALAVLGAVLYLYLLDQFTYLFMDAWLLESLSLDSVFWTNFKTGAALFIWGFIGTAFSIASPAYFNSLDREWQRIFGILGLIGGGVGGYLLAGGYLDFLMLFGGVTVGEVDPVFGLDLGFFMFKLPGIWEIWYALTIPMAAGLVASFFASWLGSAKLKESFNSNFQRVIYSICTMSCTISIALLGILSAVGIWLSRYDLVYAVKDTAPYFSGADYVDVTGFFSTLNYVTLTAILVLVDDIVLLLILRRLNREMKSQTTMVGGTLFTPVKRLVAVALILLAIDFLFASAVAVRQVVMVRPNEPVIQLPFIKRHMESTLKAWDIDKVETTTFIPASVADPVPDVAKMMSSPSMKNAPLWPGWVSYVERLLDPQHADRVMITKGDAKVYGPVLDVLQAEQKLRTYYNFLDVDSVRYTINGEKRLLVSSVRELPLSDPQDWISHWGQRTLLYTHGHGLVTAPASEISGDGDLNYYSQGIPNKSKVSELELSNPAVYYGHGYGIGAEGSMAATNASGIQELSFPTDEDRELVTYSPDVKAGVKVDTFLKRLIIGWRSNAPIDIWFSNLITSETRMHYFRSPLERVERIAPFLFTDSNVTAVIYEGRIVWLVNGVTTSNHYPYSWRWTLGDKSTDQHFRDRPVRVANYARDSVKIVVDGYTGDVSFYKIKDEPVADTWAGIYPALFKDGDGMPTGIRKHIQYPQELYHAQFDDMYILYHMKDPMAYFHLEDMWDDADEVKGPILGEGDAITFSIEPRNWMIDTGQAFPASAERVQYGLSKVFTNEQTMNLRAMTAVYQDGADYGRQVVLTIPKGLFAYGPEQADAIIDQEPEISEKISWLNRKGSEVIRGHTSTLVIEREILFVEPLFIRSKQNPVPQLKQVAVVFRGHAGIGRNLEDGLRSAIEKFNKRQIAAEIK